MMLYISMKFHDNILNGFQVIEQTRNYHCQDLKGKNYRTVKTIVTVIVFCTSSDNAIYFYKVSWQYLDRLSSYRVDTKFTSLYFQRGITQNCTYKSYAFCGLHDCLIMLYISVKFHENTFKGFQAIERTRNDHCQISKRNNYKTL